MPTMLTDAIAQLEWLVQNSDGIVGLQADGGVMPWPEVLKLYAPDLERLIDGADAQ